MSGILQSAAQPPALAAIPSLGASSKLLLKATKLSKAFPGVRALAETDLELTRGEVHGLVGANGAGKSTLINILVGNIEPDSGTLQFGDSDRLTSLLPQERRAQVSVVYQELTIVPQMSTISNVFLGDVPHIKGMTDRKAMLARFEELSANVGVRLLPHSLAGTLSIADQQMVEIMRALQRRRQLIILDEPTAPLGPTERSNLYSLINRLKSAGTTVLFVSHDLKEVISVCDHITVLRDGRSVASDRAKAWSEQALVIAMAGQERSFAPKITPRSDKREILKINGLRHSRGAPEISLTLHQGEILGVAGLVGSGRSEALRCIAGAEKPISGSMFVHGTPIHWPRSVHEAIQLGVVLAPEDRKQQGLILTKSSATNIALTNLQALSLLGVVRRQRSRNSCKRVADSVGLPRSKIDIEARHLSGGNQQKVVIGKWLQRRPAVLLLDEPTRGIDIAAKTEIYRMIKLLAAESGMGVIFVSSDFEEILEHSDRILVLSANKRVDIHRNVGLSVEHVLHNIFRTEGAH